MGIEFLFSFLEAFRLLQFNHFSCDPIDVVPFVVHSFIQIAEMIFATSVDLLRLAEHFQPIVEVIPRLPYYKTPYLRRFIVIEMY